MTKIDMLWALVQELRAEVKELRESQALNTTDVSDLWGKVARLEAKAERQEKRLECEM